MQTLGISRLIKRRDSIVIISAVIMALLTFSLLLILHVLTIFPYTIRETIKSERPRHIPVACDLDGNGISEMVVFAEYSRLPVAEIYGEENEFIDVIRMPGEFPNDALTYYFADTDGDDLTELYLVYTRNDSILLSGFEYKGGGHFLEDMFIADYHKGDFQNNMHVIWISSERITESGPENLFIIVRSGFSKVPRQVFRIDPWEKQVYSSPNSGAAYILMSALYRNNCLSRVVTGANAYQNYLPEDSILFNDNSGWVIAYEPDLGDPVFVKEYPAYKSYISPVIRDVNGEIYYFVLVNRMEKGDCYLEKLDEDGNLVDSVIVDNITKEIFLLNSLDEKLDRIVLKTPGSLISYDYNLNLLKRTKDPMRLIHRTYYGDRDVFARYDLIPFLNGDRLVIKNLDLKVIARERIYNNINFGLFFSIRETGDPHFRELIFSSWDHAYYYSFRKNWLYTLRLPAYLFLLTTIFFLYYGIFRIQNTLVQRRFITRQSMSQLQMQSMLNQLQPHFTFNVLNSIGSLIYKDQKDAAYKYLNSFSDMLRSTLLSYNQSDWPLKEELAFIRIFLEMENLRFDNRFELEINIEAEVDEYLLVPKLAIQSFVENAVRHGLIHKEGPGRIKLNVIRKDQHIVVKVEDNGIGRKASASLQRSKSGVGLKILGDFIKSYNMLNNNKFELDLTDLTDEAENAMGTRVVLKIPNDYNKNLKRQ